MQAILKSALRSIATIPLILLGLVWAQTASAHSHEGPGEHVQTFEKNLAIYAADVEKLSATLDGIAGQYVAERDTQAAIDAFIEQWEVMKYHEAVETVAIPLYPPIWAAISKMQKALEEEASIRDFVASVNAVKHALHEGMGGVRLSAAQRVQGVAATQNLAAMAPSEESESQARPASQDEIQAIKAALDAALEAYGEGNPEAAKTRIGDAYLYRFEGLEGDLIALNADLVSTLEREFNVDLPVLIDSEKPVQEVAAMVEQMKGRLDQAAELLAQADANKSEVF